MSVFVYKIQNNGPVNVNESPNRITVRNVITGLLHGYGPVNDDIVKKVLFACIRDEFVEELQLAVRLPRSPVE